MARGGKTRRTKGSKRRGVAARKKRKPPASFRSAITGRYVTKATAKRHPRTTVEERR